MILDCRAILKQSQESKWLDIAKRWMDYGYPCHQQYHSQLVGNFNDRAQRVKVKSELDQFIKAMACYLQ